MFICGGVLPVFLWGGVCVCVPVFVVGCMFLVGLHVFLIVRGCAVFEVGVGWRFL